MELVQAYLHRQSPAPKKMPLPRPNTSPLWHVANEEPIPIKQLKADQYDLEVSVSVWNIWFWMSIGMLLLSNILAAVFEPTLPIGFFPLPFVIGFYTILMKKKQKLAEVNRTIDKVGTGTSVVKNGRPSITNYIGM